MVPKEEQLLKFIKSKDFVNFSLIAKHFNIQNTTVSDLIKDLEEKNLVDVISFSGSKVVKLKEDKMKKRGQVTTFVILGIVLVVALIGVFFINRYVLKSEFEREQEKISVTEQFLPVKNYFDSCIKSVALDGAIALGLQGGYLTMPEDEFPVNPVVPFSNRLQIFGNNALEVPYWFYETANGIQKTQIPSVQDMENSLQTYINQNVNNCLTNFTEFQDYEISGFDDVNTEVTIEDSKIFVKVLSKLSVNYKGLTQEFDRFLVTLDVPLGKLYNKAKDVLEKENNEYFFEQKTIDMLVLYEELPYSGLNLNCNPRIWATENVKKDLRKIIKNNMEVYNPNAVNKYYVYDINSENANINFKYEEEWPLFLEIDGGEQILKEQSAYGENNPAASFLRTLFCLNYYHFIYDLKYPVLVSLNENNFDFQYATMVVVDNNQPRENRLGIEAPADSTPIICERASVKATINALDQETNNAIDNVNVKFSCVGTTCNLGETTTNGLITKVPACLNAVISLEKQGYTQTRTTIDTTEETSLFLYLKPKYKKNVDIKIITNNGFRDPIESEFVTFTLTNLDDETQIIFNNEINEIELSEGEYEVNSFILRNYESGIKLDKQELQYCTDIPRAGVLGLFGFTESRCTKTEIPESELDQVLVGGAKFKFTITKEELKNSNTITFYTLFNKIPNTLQELNDIHNLIQQESNTITLPKLT